MARTGGNPLLKEYQIKSNRAEPLLSHLSMRITNSMMGQLKSLDEDWREIVRVAISEKLQRENKG